MNYFLIIGYIVFCLYTVGIMGLGAVLEKRTAIPKTLCRKLVHIVSSFVWVICYYFFGCTIHWVVLNGIGAVLLGVAVFSGKMKAFSCDDAKNSVGIFYFGLSTFIVALVCYLFDSELYLYTGIAYYCLSLGDGFAPVFAEVFKKKNITIREGKTLVGTLSVFVVSFLSTLIFSLIFKMNLSLPFILSVAALTCIVEFYSVKGLDNLFIEFSVFGYLVLYSYGLALLPLQTVLIISPFLAMLAIKSKTMSVSGGVCAFLLFAFVGFFGRNFLPCLFIFVLFGISTVALAIGKRFKKGQTNNDSEGGRSAKQIVAVGLFGLLFLIAYYFSNVKLFYYLFFLSFVEQFADSMASDIGSMTKGKTLNVITFKPMEKGISGGVSLLGTVSSAVSSFLLTALPLLFNAISFKIYVSISLFAFLGTIVDSLLGSIAQALYKCEVCGKLIENPLHCSFNAKLVKGFKFIDNVAVNYLSGAVTCVLGCLLPLF